MFPSDSTRVTVFWNIGPLRHIAFLPSLGHRNDHPCLSCKIGPDQFFFFDKLFRVLEYSSRPIWSIRVPVWPTPNRLLLRGGESLEADSGYVRAGSN